MGQTEVYKFTDEIDSNSEADMIVPLQNGASEKFIVYEKPKITKKDPLQMELVNFINSIKGKETPIVTGEEGRNALEVATKIQNMINHQENYNNQPKEAPIYIRDTQTNKTKTK